MVDTFSGALKILSRRKLASSPGVGHHVLQRSLSAVDITCLGLSTTIGTGIYTILAFAAREHSGPSIVLSFLIASVGSCLGGLCYTELSSRFPSGGSAYSYVYTTIGELPAFLIGWSLMFEYYLSVILSAKTLIQYFDGLSNGTLINSFRFKLTTETNESIFLDLPSALLVLTIGFLLKRNLKSTCVFNNVLTFVSLLVIGGIVLTCVFEVDADNWTAGPGFFPNGVVGIFSGASVCFFAFNGYDIIGSLSSEAETTERTKSIAIAISLTFLFGLIACFTVSIAITLLVPFSLLDPNAPILQAFITRHLDGMQYFVIIGATTGLISSAIASLLSLSRLLFCLSNDGLLMTFLSKYDTNTGLTKSATTFSCIVCAISCVCFETTTILHLIGTGTIISYIFVSLCILILRYCSSETLPFESCELMSRETTLNDMRQRSHDMTQSISDYYLKSENQSYKGMASQCRKFDNNLSNEIFCDSIQSSNDCNRQINCGNNYGSCEPTHQMSVEFINQTFITCLSDSSFTSKQEPTKTSQKCVTVTTLVMMGTMLLMAITTIHIPRLSAHQIYWWTELLATLLFIIICVCIVIIVRQPRHHSSTASIRNSIPCVPLLPICAIWLDIHLIVCLPYTSWLALSVWSLLGVFAYMGYGVWYSLEGLVQTESDHINELVPTEISDESEELIACDQEVIGSSV